MSIYEGTSGGASAPQTTPARYCSTAVLAFASAYVSINVGPPASSGSYRILIHLSDIARILLQSSHTMSSLIAPLVMAIGPPLRHDRIAICGATGSVRCRASLSTSLTTAVPRRWPVPRPDLASADAQAIEVG